MSKLITVNWDEVDKLPPVDEDATEKLTRDIARKLLALKPDHVLAIQSFGEATIDLGDAELGISSGSTIHRVIVIIYKEA